MIRYWHNVQTVVCKVSGVTCSIEHLAAAEVAPTTTASARALLLAFFDLEVLLKAPRTEARTTLIKQRMAGQPWI